MGTGPRPTWPCIRAQGKVTGLAQVCMHVFSLHSWPLTLSSVALFLALLPRCVLSSMSGIQSRCTLPTGQLPHPCALGRGTFHSSP